TYIKVFYGAVKLFKNVPIIPHLRPALGAALAGLIGVSLYYLVGEDRRALGVLSAGYGALQDSMVPHGTIGIQLLLLVALVKIVTTALTIGSGGSGGVIGPSIVIGGCLGGAVGQYFHTLWPELVPHP